MCAAGILVAAATQAILAHSRGRSGDGWRGGLSQRLRRSPQMLLIPNGIGLRDEFTETAVDVSNVVQHEFVYMIAWRNGLDSGKSRIQSTSASTRWPRKKSFLITTAAKLIRVWNAIRVLLEMTVTGPLRLTVLSRRLKIATVNLARPRKCSSRGRVEHECD